MKEHSTSIQQENRTQERLATVALPSCFALALTAVVIAVVLTA